MIPLFSMTYLTFVRTDSHEIFLSCPVLTHQRCINAVSYFFESRTTQFSRTGLITESSASERSVVFFLTPLTNHLHIVSQSLAPPKRIELFLDRYQRPVPPWAEAYIRTHQSLSVLLLSVGLWQPWPVLWSPLNESNARTLFTRQRSYH